MKSRDKDYQIRMKRTCKDDFTYTWGYKNKEHALKVYYELIDGWKNKIISCNLYFRERPLRAFVNLEK